MCHSSPDGLQRGMVATLAWRSALALWRVLRGKDNGTGPQRAETEPRAAQRARADASSGTGGSASAGSAGTVGTGGNGAGGSASGGAAREERPAAAAGRRDGRRRIRRRGRQGRRKRRQRVRRRRLAAKAEPAAAPAARRTGSGGAGGNATGSGAHGTGGAGGREADRHGRARNHAREDQPSRAPPDLRRMGNQPLLVGEPRRRLVDHRTATRSSIPSSMPRAASATTCFATTSAAATIPTHHHMGQYKDMPGFEPSAGTWTWDVDANQRAVLQRIVANGTNVILEAFSNSPPYWMTKSGCASGNTDGSNNLKDASYDAFADYLTEVVKHYRDTFGITFRTLEALNEPNASWWTANGGQEGCHFSPSNQQTIVKALGTQLAAKGLTGTTVSASDENSIDDGYNNLRGIRHDVARGHEPDERPHLLGQRPDAAARARDQQGQAPLAVGVWAAQSDAGGRHRRRGVHGGPDHLRSARPAARGLDRLAGRRSEHELGELHPQRHEADVWLPEAVLHARRLQPLHSPRSHLRRYQRDRHGRRGQRPTDTAWWSSFATGARPRARGSPST